MSNVQEVKEQASNSELVTVSQLIDRNGKEIDEALPAGYTRKKFSGLFMLAINHNPNIVGCSQNSLLGAAIQTVQLGLIPGPIAHCYYVPYNNKQKDGSYRKEVQFMIGYRGLIELINRSGKASIIATEVVYENDDFDYEQGLTPYLHHKPAPKDRGEIIGAYCIAKNMIANEKCFVYLDRETLDKHKNASKAGSSEYSPWNKWLEAMCKKTTVKVISKILPLSIEDQRQIAQDETIKTELAKDMSEVPDLTEWEDVPEGLEEPDDADILDSVQARLEVLAEAEESYPEQAASQQEKPREKPTVKPEQPIGRPAPSVKSCISEKQRKRLWAIAGGNGWEEGSMKEYLWNLGKITSTHHIKWGDEYDGICAYFETHSPTDK